jgi:cell division transport system permease protein
LIWSQAKFVTRQVWNSLRGLFWTHFLTAITMTMTLFVFGAFMLLQENLQNLLKQWGDQIQINAYLEKNLSASDTQRLLDRIRGFPEVQRARYISQQEAWKDFKSALGAQSGILEGLPEDVLPPSFEIALNPGFRDAPLVDALAVRLKKEKGITVVEYPQEWVDRLSLVVLAVQWAKWLLGGVLFSVTFFIVGSTVKLAILARKDEIEMMQLFGASEEMIQAPFVVEGMTQGIVGGVLSVLCLWFLFDSLRDQIPPAAGLVGPFTQIEFLNVRSMALILAIGWALGAAGSLFSLRRFVKSWRS